MPFDESFFSEARLSRNLAALDETDPELAARLRLPVDGEHVTIGADGALVLHWHRSTYPLAAPAPDVASLPVDGKPVHVFGVGDGDAPQRLLAAGHGRVLVWDRDPWLLRLLLGRYDLVAALRERRLRLVLGADLLSLREPEARVVRHPLLAELYRFELDAFERPGTARALLCTGGVFVDQLGEELRRRGYSLWSLDLRRLAIEELSLTLKRVRPELVVAERPRRERPRARRAADVGRRRAARARRRAATSGPSG